MAFLNNIHAPISMATLLISYLLFFFSCYSYKAFAYEAADVANGYHLVDIDALLPQLNCSASAGDSERRSQGLQILSRYGPCSPLSQEKTPSSSHKILLRDQSRVHAINNRMFNQYAMDESQVRSDKSTPEEVVGGSNYFITVGFGTPKRDYPLIFDTGSDITWVKCKPCLNCSSQKYRIFDPSLSSSYSNGSCIPSSDKNYDIGYRDGSYSNGQYACDTLTLPLSDVFPDFQFGCDHNDSNNFGDQVGILGLGPGELSLVSQTAKIFGETFSYCLPPKDDSTAGHLLFGKAAAAAASSSSLKFTPISRNPNYPYYFLQLIDISVAQKRLNISPSVFNSPGTIIDSGTVITHLPMTAYSALRSAFIQSMSKYPSASPPSDEYLLDTCYDLSRYKKVVIPEIVLHFGGGADVSLHESGILWTESKSSVCLAFAGNKDEKQVGIIGSNQQKSLEVFYDIKGGRVGFGMAAGCNN